MFNQGNARVFVGEKVVEYFLRHKKLLCNLELCEIILILISAS